MSKAYWFDECHRCRQGRLVIEKLKASNDLVLHCDECEQVWKDPYAIDRLEDSILGIDIEMDPAEWGDIQLAGWEQFAPQEYEVAP